MGENMKIRTSSRQALSTDYTAPNGSEWTASHTLDEVNAILAAVRTAQPDTFLEVGMGWGGLSAILAEAYPALEIHTVDRSTRAWTPEQAEHFEGHVTTYQMDFLGTPHELTALFEGLGGKRMLYCDGGNKLLELGMYARLLREGEWVGVHDWSWFLQYGLQKAVEYLLIGYSSRIKIGRVRWLERTNAKVGNSLDWERRDKAVSP